MVPSCDEKLNFLFIAIISAALLLIPFSSEVGSRFGDEEPPAVGVSSSPVLAADFQDLLRPRWESASVGSVTYRSACSLNWANSMKYYRIIFHCY